MDDKFDILSGGETPISLINEKQMAGLAEQLTDFIKSGDPRARRLREFIEAGYSPEEIAHKINKLLIKIKSVPGKDRNLLDVNKGALDTEQLKISEIVQESKELFDISNFMFDLMDSDYAKGLFRCIF